MTKDEALKLALEALEYLPEMRGIEEAITAIKEASAQPEERVTKIAWDARGAAFAEREAVEALLREYDMVDSAFAKDFRARGHA